MCIRDRHGSHSIHHCLLADVPRLLIRRLCHGPQKIRDKRLGLSLIHILLRYKGYNARRTLHQLRNAGTCIFVVSAQLLFRIIQFDVLETEKADRNVLPSHFVPDYQLFIKDILYLCRSQFANPILLIRSQYIPFFYHLAAEQA